jgi:hypothetical protein
MTTSPKAEWAAIEIEDRGRIIFDCLHFNKYDDQSMLLQNMEFEIVYANRDIVSPCRRTLHH